MNPLKKLEAFFYLTEKGINKEDFKEQRTIVLQEDFLDYKRGYIYNISGNMLLELALKKVSYIIIEKDETKPIISRFEIDRSDMNQGVKKRIEQFEKEVSKK